MQPEPNAPASSNSTSQRTIAIVALVIVNALWGLSFPIMKSLNQQIDTHFVHREHTADSQIQVAFTSGMIGLRFLIAFALLAILCPGLVRGANRSEWKAGICVGLFFYFGLVLQVMGLATIPASRSGFLTSLTAVFTPVIYAIMFRKFPSWNVILGILLAVMGVSVLTGLVDVSGAQFRIADDATQKWTVGDTLTTIGSLLFTGQLLLVDYFGRRMNSAAITPGMFVAVIVASGITFLSLYRLAGPDGERAMGSVQSLVIWREMYFEPVFFGLICFLALFCSVFAFLGMNRYQPAISAVQASIIYSTEPVFASLWALVIPGALASINAAFGYANEQISWPLLLGGAFILIANIVALWPKAKT